MYVLSLHIWLKGVDRPVSVTIDENKSGERFSSRQEAEEFRTNMLDNMRAAILARSNTNNVVYQPIDSLIINVNEVSCVYIDIKNR